ncbi:MAG: hypothetical protein GC157_08840 [Frankiales bacterium]|nr:hypothetical protein [Frankiales bacterium]
MARVDLYWIPLGAGSRVPVVRVCGRAYERLVAWRDRRDPAPLFHAALLLHGDDATYAVEMAPVWGREPVDRGVVATGPVGAAVLGRSRMFRYEVCRWRGGRIPDLAFAVGGATTVLMGPEAVGRALRLLDEVPVHVWGRDELGAGDMWNSNSVVAWLLARAGADVGGLHPPGGGRAPGWSAGLVA